MTDRRNFAIVSDEVDKADSLKKVLESILPFAVIKTYRFDDFIPAKYSKDFNRDKPIVIIVASSILEYAREVNIIRRLRICRDLDEDARKVPVLLLTYEDHLGIIKRYPDGILLLSEGCAIIQIPFKLEYLKIKIETAKEVRDFNKIRDFLHLESRLAQIEKQDKHGLANYLGPVRLLRGAYLSGEFGKVNEDGKRLYDDITTYLKQKQHSIDYYSEYLDLQEALPIVIETENKKGKIEQKATLIKLREKFQGHRMILIDDEHEKGWSEVLRNLLIPVNKMEINDFLWCAKDQTIGTEFYCVSKVGASQKTDDFSNIEKILGLNDPEKKWINYDLILLDLRLKKDLLGLPVEETSGYSLLNYIRKKDQTVPVIMFTASEKAATLRALQKLGISGYFIKELPSSNDTISMMSFEKFKQSMTDVIDKHYLRDIWFYTVTFKEIFSSGLKFKEYFRLLEGAYLRIWNARDSYDYNMAILIYFDCLNKYIHYDAKFKKMQIQICRSTRE